MKLIVSVLFLFLLEIHSQVYKRYDGKKLYGAPKFVNGTADTSEVCSMKIPRCNPLDYRSLDGTCNNLKKPIRGTRESPFQRMLPAAYSNGGRARVTKDGSPLPLARKVRTTILQDGRVTSNELTALGFHSIEFYVVDILLINGIRDYLFDRQYCCTPAGAADPRCMPVLVPDDDPYLGNTDIRCMNFSRAETFQNRGCIPDTLQPQQVNSATAHLDLHMIYGTTVELNRQLRTMEDGLMKTEIRKGREMPLIGNSTNCMGNLPNETACYLFGDPMSNFDLRLITLNIMFLKQHNMIARKLRWINHCWNDDKLFNVARKINIAISQNLYYYELSPLLFGKDNLLKSGVIQDEVKFVNDYDPHIEPLTYAEAGIAFRFFHNLLEGRVKLYDKYYKQSNQFFQSNTIFRADVVEDDFNLERLNRGSFVLKSAASDFIVDPDLSETFFSSFFRTFDLYAIDIQRSRDKGIPPYNQYRKYCGLPRAKKFDDLSDVMDFDMSLMVDSILCGIDEESRWIYVVVQWLMALTAGGTFQQRHCSSTVVRDEVVWGQQKIDELRSVYKHVDDIDLLAGIYSERLLEGTQSGPTMLCIAVRIYLDTRRADRYWFERGDHHQAFTEGQLEQIRRSTFARLACDQASGIRRIQPEALRLADKGNAVVPCRLIPRINFTEWKDPFCLDPVKIMVKMASTLENLGDEI